MSEQNDPNRPYFIEDQGDIKAVCGPTLHTYVCREIMAAKELCDTLNAAYAAGRTALESQLAEVNKHLGNLLAVIHRDGGHYISQHGMEKAVADAMKLSTDRIHDASLVATARNDNAEIITVYETKLAAAARRAEDMERSLHQACQLADAIRRRAEDAERAVEVMRTALDESRRHFRMLSKVDQSVTWDAMCDEISKALTAAAAIERARGGSNGE